MALQPGVFEGLRDYYGSQISAEINEDKRKREIASLMEETAFGQGELWELHFGFTILTQALCRLSTRSCFLYHDACLCQRLTWLHAFCNPPNTNRSTRV